jgi:hypothetical protein
VLKLIKEARNVFGKLFEKLENSQIRPIANGDQTTSHGCDGDAGTQDPSHDACPQASGVDAQAKELEILTLAAAAALDEPDELPTPTATDAALNAHRKQICSEIKSMSDENLAIFIKNSSSITGTAKKLARARKTQKREETAALAVTDAEDLTIDAPEDDSMDVFENEGDSVSKERIASGGAQHSSQRTRELVNITPEDLAQSGLKLSSGVTTANALAMPPPGSAPAAADAADAADAALPAES